MRCKKSKIVSLLFIIVLNVINLSLFVFLLYLVKIEVDNPGPNSEYYFNALSLQMVFLEVVLASVAIAFAILGFVGYQAVKNAAVDKALEETRKQVQTHLNKLVSPDGFDSDVSQPTNTSPVIGPGAEVDPTDIKLEEKI